MFVELGAQQLPLVDLLRLVGRLKGGLGIKPSWGYLTEFSAFQSLPRAGYANQNQLHQTHARLVNWQ